MYLAMLDAVKEHWDDAAGGRSRHDFGQGSVPAHRHFNPDGQLGGWVAESAYVSPDAMVEDGALVYGDAHIGKGVKLLSGAIVRERANLNGRLIVGRKVIFENYATCRVPHQVRHPVYIGFDPKMFPLAVYEKGKRRDVVDDLPYIVCQEHPVIVRWFQKGSFHNVVMTDEMVIHTRTHRGYEPIADYREEHGEGLYGHSLRYHTSVYAADNVRGHYPVMRNGELIWPDRPVKRVGRMPTTVGDPKFYMNH